MIRLSVNVNKIATLRNSRGGAEPRVLGAVDACLKAGAGGITIHPRADRRHITPDDVRQIADRLSPRPAGVEYNIEGDPRPDLLSLVLEAHPDQCTLVPVMPGEITSQRGWIPGPTSDGLRDVIASLKTAGIRVSLFVDPDPRSIELAAELDADRVELYTEPFARAYERGAVHAQAAFKQYEAAANIAAALRLGVNAGHDLDLRNLALFRALPHLAEVSIGHALVSRTVFVGLDTVVREYLAVLNS